jgi:hypothetical protein
MILHLQMILMPLYLQQWPLLLLLPPTPQRLTCSNAPRTFIFPTVTSSSSGEQCDDDDGPPFPPPTTHAPFDMTSTNAPLTPRLPRELHNLETFYNP